jgi:murein DD-endopeptidase MepM/ murein hydrolase activator NlpD
MAALLLASGAAAQPAAFSAPAQAPQSEFTFSGEATQGGWIRGRAPAGTVAAHLGDESLNLDDQGRFFAAFDRDAGPEATLVAELDDGATVTTTIAVSPRAWNLEHVDAPLRPGGQSSEAFMRRRQPELDRIWAAREQATGAQGWLQTFIWPVRGRISGRFGSQRIYRGEPGSYHTGLDIAPGAGTPFVAPADGVVVLAAHDDFSLEGKLIIIDHGQGLNSAFLHAQRIDVNEGDHVTQGQRLGLVGQSGRVSGPHLHWSIKWHNGARLDPLLFLDRTP